MTTTFGPTLFFQLVDLGGVLANGVLGGFLARRLGFDPVGFVVLALISGLGGGILRDTLLQAGPPVALTNPAYLLCGLGGALIAFLVDMRGNVSRRGLVIADALALGAWSATGTVKALGVGLPVLSAVLLGVTTAVGGGMIRDLVVREVPSVFSGTLYATVALVCSSLMAAAAQVEESGAGMAASIVVALVLVLASRRFGWTLPQSTDLRTHLPTRREWRS